jgi:predicted glycosyltransferase
MRILFFTGGTTGSGHIVLGLSIAAALKRSGLLLEAYAILSLETPFALLAQGLGIPVITIPAEDGVALDKEHYESSALYSAIVAFSRMYLCSMFSGLAWMPSYVNYHAARSYC